FREMRGVGSHEVVIESPLHDARLDTMTQDQVGRVIDVWRRRCRDLLALPHIRAVVVFKNFGPLAGTSLVHPHSQVVGTPVFLPRLLRRLDVATRYYDENGICVYDDVIAAERSAGARVVDECGKFLAFEPFAAASPFETWIAPTFHQGSFHDLADEDVGDLACVLIRTLDALRRTCGDPDFNLVVYSAPTNGHEIVFHWHMKIIPRLSTQAGFEMGSAMSINTVPPEIAAAALRNTLAATAGNGKQRVGGNRRPEKRGAPTRNRARPRRGAAPPSAPCRGAPGTRGAGARRSSPSSRRGPAATPPCASDRRRRLPGPGPPGSARRSRARPPRARRPRSAGTPVPPAGSARGRARSARCRR